MVCDKVVSKMVCDKVVCVKLCVCVCENYVCKRGCDKVVCEKWCDERDPSASPEPATRWGDGFRAKPIWKKKC